MRTIFISSTVLLTVVWALGFGLLSAYAVVVAFFRLLMPKPNGSTQHSAVSAQPIRTAEEGL